MDNAVDTGLARRQRILSPLLFQKIMKEGRSHAGRYLVAWMYAVDSGSRGRSPFMRSVLEGERPREPHLGVVASKRTFRRAVDRNRAKRLLREAFRLNRAALEGERPREPCPCEPFDVVLLARGRILSAKRQDVEADLRDVIKNISRKDAKDAKGERESH